MHIVETSTAKKHKVEIIRVEDSDYKNLGEDRYFFDWRAERKYEIYKLQIQGFNDILGIISIEDIPSEWRVHIRLFTVSRENRGKEKKYERIAGNLIAYAAKIAVKKYAELACVSLRPKPKIANYYITKYNMTPTGLTLSIEVPEILNLINLYYHDK